MRNTLWQTDEGVRGAQGEGVIWKVESKLDGAVRGGMMKDGDGVW